MRFLSTAGEAPPVGFREALLGGLAPDGGLYLPEEIVAFDRPELEALRERPFPEVAHRVAERLLGGSATEPELRAMVQDAFDFPAPLVEIAPRRYVLELFRGPTLAFKDFGARFMARALVWAVGEGSEPPEGPVTLLAATSGDTGSAVAHAFSGLESFRVVVLYPRDQISEAQRKLFTTLSGNVVAVEVDGAFDDCQRLVKEAFQNHELRRQVPLAAANSINVGRLLPQCFYYFHAAGQLPFDSRRRLVVAVPSGNFGNLTAGLIAARLGLGIDRFVAATNRNDTVPRYLESGRLEPRPSIETLSNAMDVGDPNNVARIQALYAGDLDALRTDVAARSFDDEATLQAISDVHASSGYVLDPHSAVGYLGLEEELRQAPSSTVGIALATAHPAKFAAVVERAIGAPVEIPPQLQRCLEHRESVIRMPADGGRLAALLTGM